MEPVADPSNIEAFARAIFDAVTSKNYALVAALAVVALVYLARKYAGPKVPFLQTDKGGVLLSLATSFAGALATALFAGGPISLALVSQALIVAFTASGGWSMIRKLFFTDDAAKAKALAEAAGKAAKGSTAAKAKAAGAAKAKAAPTKSKSLAEYINGEE